MGPAVVVEHAGSGMTHIERVERAIADIAAGRPVVVAENDDRESRGDLVFAAAKATPELMAFMVRHTSGYVCVSLTGADCDRLDLPPMRRANQDARGRAFTVTVDARDGVSTGISAADRAHTVRLLADPGAEAGDFVRPGHVVPLRASEGGVLRRPGRTEAAVDLTRAAGQAPAGALCEIVSGQDTGEMARGAELAGFAADHDLRLITIADLVSYRRRSEKLVARVAEARLPTAHGEFRAIGYHSRLDGLAHVALVMGEPGEGTEVLVRVHPECLLGDVLGSLRCDCGPQLGAAMAAVAAEGRGVVLYLRRPESRGRQIGSAQALRACRPQGIAAPSAEADPGSGRPPGVDDLGTEAQILADLGVRSVRLLTDDPATKAGLEAYGLEIGGLVPLPFGPGTGTTPTGRAAPVIGAALPRPPEART